MNGGDVAPCWCRPLSHIHEYLSFSLKLSNKNPIPQCPSGALTFLSIVIGGTVLFQGKVGLSWRKSITVVNPHNALEKDVKEG